MSTTNDVLWNQKAAEVALWVNVHKRIPKRSRTVGVEENRLGRWLEDNERSITKNTGHNLVTPARAKRIASIKELISSTPKKKTSHSRERVHLLTQKERWNLNAHTLAVFQKENGRNPQRLSGDIDEDKLAAWRMSQQKASEERKLKLDEIAPGWRGNARNREIKTTEDWKLVADQYIAFTQEHNHVPRSPTINRENLPNEQRLYFWMNQQRFFFNKNKLDEDRKTYLDEKTPGWSDVSSRHEGKWEAQFTFVKTFYAEYGRFPTVHKDKNDVLTKKAAVWLQNQRYALNNYDSLSEKEKNRLDILRTYLVSISVR